MAVKNRAVISTERGCVSKTRRERKRKNRRKVKNNCSPSASFRAYHPHPLVFFVSSSVIFHRLVVSKKSVQFRSRFQSTTRVPISRREKVERPTPNSRNIKSTKKRLIIAPFHSTSLSFFSSITTSARIL